MISRTEKRSEENREEGIDFLFFQKEPEINFMDREMKVYFFEWRRK